MKKICEVPNCNKEVKARGLCGAHYSQLRRTGSPTGSLKDKESIVPGGFVPRFIKDRDARCSIPGCENLQISRGWCNTHYLRWLNHGDPLIVFNTGTQEDPCSKCGINQRRLDHSWCQPCLNEVSRERNASEKGPRWRRYKLTKTDIENMKLSQLNSCMICGDSFDLVDDHVDHDNSCCGKEKTRNSGTCGECIRDLLCGSCNQGLGNFKDSIERLLSAVTYLEKWNAKEIRKE